MGCVRPLAPPKGAPAFPTCRPEPWRWPAPRVMVPRIIGLSADGWFAYAERDERTGRDDIFLFNLTCEDSECVTDTPPFPGDFCYCPYVENAGGLAAYGVTHTRWAESGTFPARIDGLRYDITTNASVRPGIVLGSTTTVTEIWLQKQGGEPTLLGTIHDHLTSRVDLVCAAGWLRSPYGDRSQVAVIVGYGTAEGGDQPDAVRFKFFAAKVANAAP